MDRAGDEGRHDLTSTPELDGDRPAASPDVADGHASPAAGRRTRVWLLIHLATLAVAAGVLLWFNRNQWFFGDEWEFIVNRGLVDSRFSLFYPHNEHWSTLPILAYTALLNTVGLASYWPYISLLIVIQLVLTHLLWRVMIRSGVAPLIATAAAAVFALFGAGSENLLWAFQIGFVGSLAFGWAAALVVDRSDRLCRRDGWAVALLIAGLMCSGIGVPTVAVVTLLALARSRGLLRPLVVGGVPTAIFLIWYVVQPQPPAPPWETAAQGGLLSLARYVVRSLRETIVAGTELPSMLALLVVAALGVFTVVRTIAIIRRRPGAVDGAIAVAGLYGAAGFFVISGFGRGGDEVASRYVYVAIAMALPGIALALSRLARPIWAQAVVAAGLAVVLVVNVISLRDRSHDEADREQLVKQTIVAAGSLLANGETIIGDKPEPVYDPDITVESMPWLVEHGLPTDDVTAQGLASARLALQLDPDAADTALPGDVPVAVTDQGEAAITAAPGTAGTKCLSLRALGATPPYLVLASPGESAVLRLDSPIGGPFALSLPGAPDAREQVSMLEPGKPRFLRIGLPAGTLFTLTLAMPESVVCGIR